LRLGRRTIDLVREHNVGDDRPSPELELGGALVVNRDAGDVGGQQIWRELNALEGATRGAGQAFGEHSLADARDVFDQQVTRGRQADDRQLRLGMLADQNLLDRVDEAAQCLRTAHRAFRTAPGALRTMASLELLPRAARTRIVASNL